MHANRSQAVLNIRIQTAKTDCSLLGVRGNQAQGARDQGARDQNQISAQGTHDDNIAQVKDEMNEGRKGSQVRPFMSAVGLYPTLHCLLYPLSRHL